MIRKELGELCHYVETDYGAKYVYAPFIIEDIEEFVQLEKENELPEWGVCLSDILIDYISSCESHTEGMIYCNGDYDPRISKVYVTKEQCYLLIERFGNEEIDDNIEIWP